MSVVAKEEHYELLVFFLFENRSKCIFGGLRIIDELSDLQECDQIKKIFLSEGERIYDIFVQI
jgi:hypothetical protein